MVDRYFGAQYDPVNQAAYLDYVVNNEAYKGKIPFRVLLDSYTARLRLDILFHDSVILADTMFFDGVYFQTLFLHKEMREGFTHFFRLSSIGGIHPCIEIHQRRKTVGETLKDMLYKQNSKYGFFFNSLGSDYFKIKVAEALSRAQNSGREFYGWKDIMDLSIGFAEEENVRDAIKQKIEILKYMEELSPNLFRVWEGEFNFQKFVEDAQKKERFRIIRTGDPVIDGLVMSIEKEIKEKFPDRNKLQNEIALKTRIFARPPTKMAEERLERLWGQFIQVYNRALAAQLSCNNIDLGDDGSNTVKFVVEELSQSTLQALAQDSWLEFGIKYNNLRQFREQWIHEVWELGNQQKRSDMDGRKALESLVKQISREFRVAPTFRDYVNVVGGGASLHVDLMSSNEISLGIHSNNIFTILVQVLDLAKRQWVYKKDNANLIKLGPEFLIEIPAEDAEDNEQ